MSTSLRIVNARDPSGCSCTLNIRDGRFVREIPPGEKAVVMDAGGKVVFPGVVDMHVHFRDPWEGSPGAGGETIRSGTAAALNGGVTACACMPNTRPPLDSPAAVRYVVEKAAEAGDVRIFPVAAITRGRAGRETVDFPSLLAAGAVAFSDDGSPVLDDRVMQRALEASRVEGFPVITHALDERGYEGWVFHRGSASRRFSVKGIPSFAEYTVVERDIDLVRKTGGRLHVAHVSTRETVMLVKRAKEEGLPVTCEVTPHHLFLTEEDITEPACMYKMVSSIAGAPRPRGSGGGTAFRRDRRRGVGPCAASAGGEAGPSAGGVRRDGDGDHALSRDDGTRLPRPVFACVRR